MRDNTMRKKLANGEQALGLWAGLGSEAAVEMASSSGFDWILIDCEHGVAGYEALPGLLRSLTGSESTSLVRVPNADDMSIFKRVLDAGVEGVLVPQVYTANQVKNIVSACRYPPQGTRGIAGGRAHKYGADFKDTLQRSNAEILVFVQIETREAIENLDEILAVAGLDGVLVGPADLSAALGQTLNFDTPEFYAAIASILSATKRAGKPAGFYCNNPEEAKARIAQGFQFVNICNDLSILLQGFSKSLRDMNKL